MQRVNKLDRTKEWLKQYWLLFLPLVLFLPGLDAFPYPAPGAPYSDITVSHYPNAIYLIRSITEYGQIPLWSNTILSGYPFFANPLSGLHYPPGWLALFFPLPLGFNLLVMAHLLFGGWGMVKFLQKQGLSHPAVILGAVGFMSMPKLFAHYGAGHLSLMYAIPWTPWLLLATQTHHESESWKWYRQPGLHLAIIFMADPRWAVYGGLLWLGWELRYLPGRLWGWAKDTGSQIFLAALLSAPLAIPLLEYTRLSTRIHMTVEDILEFSLEPARLLGFLFPDFGGFHEYTLYVGTAVLFVVLAALLNKSARFWGWAALFSLLYAMGEYMPGMANIVQLPGFSLLRIPSRALFITSIALVVLAAYGLDAVMGGLGEKIKKRFRLTTVGLAGFGVMIVIGIVIVTGETPLNFVWGMGVMLVGAVWLGIQERLDKKAWLVGLFTIVIIDLFAVNQSLFAYRSFDNVMSEGREAAEFLAEQPGRFRIYSPSYSIPQHTAAYYGLEMANGVDPLQLESYAEYMEGATGVPREGYSITLPPMEGEDIANANESYIINIDTLGSFNVRYIISEFEISKVKIDSNIFLINDPSLLELIYDNEGKYIYRITYSSKDLPFSSATVTKYSPNQFTFTITESNELSVLNDLTILNEIYYPGWLLYRDNIVYIDYIDYLEDYMVILHKPPLFHIFEQYFTEGVFRPISLYLGLSMISLEIAIITIKQQRKNAES